MRISLASFASQFRRTMMLSVASIAMLLIGASCKKDDMAQQPRLETYGAAPRYIGGSEARPLVAGTVSRSPQDTPGTPYAYRWAPGPVGASDSVPEQASIPVSIDKQFINRGQERYNIYCSVCHGRLGNANGMIVQRGFILPPSFHNARLSNPAVTGDGHFYNVISNGYGAMFSYSERVAPADRWAIAAYIRVLQMSVKQAVKDKRISPEEFKALEGTRP
jgi:mono/diheme cytochrome c family protein